MSKIFEFLGRLEKVKGKHPQWYACCPAHDDRNPSLGVKLLDDGRILINCLAGCGGSDVLASLGLSLTFLYPNGKLGDYIPGKNRKFRKPESVYGVEGANEMARSLERKDREIEALMAKLK